MFSFSKMQLYRQCPQKYAFQYLCGYELEQKSSLDLLLGNVVHQSLQWLYSQISFFSFPSQDSFLEKYFFFWEEGVAKNDFSLSDEHVISFRERGKAYLENYYDQYGPFDQWQGQVVGTEVRLFAKLPCGESFSGTIDRLDREGGTFILNDYKTNLSLTSEQLDLYKKQLLLYAWMVQQKYGIYFDHLKIRIYVLHQNVSHEWEVSEADFLPIVQEFSLLAESLSQKEDSFRDGRDESLFPPLKNEYCKYCAFMDFCPLFSQMRLSSFGGGELQADTLAELAKQYVSTSSHIKDLEERKDQLLDFFFRYYQKYGYQRVFAFPYRLTFSERTTYLPHNKVEFEQFLLRKGLLEKVSSLSRSKIKELFELGILGEDVIGEKTSFWLAVSRKK